jgi:hypothetical protein
VQYPVYPYALRLKRLRVGLGRETSEVFKGPEGLEAKGIRKVSEQYRPLRTWGSLRNKRETPAALKKLIIKKLGVLFFT